MDFTNVYPTCLRSLVGGSAKQNRFPLLSFLHSFPIRCVLDLILVRVCYYTACVRASHKLRLKFNKIAVQPWDLLGWDEPSARIAVPNLVDAGEMDSRARESKRNLSFFLYHRRNRRKK